MLRLEIVAGTSIAGGSMDLDTTATVATVADGASEVAGKLTEDEQFVSQLEDCSCGANLVRKFDANDFLQHIPSELVKEIIQSPQDPETI